MERSGYFAHDFDRVSDRLFDAGRSGAVEVVVRVSHVVCSNAVLHALSRYSIAYWIEQIGEGELYQRPRLLTHFGIPKSGKF